MPLFLSTHPGPVLPTDRSTRASGCRCLALAEHLAIRVGFQLGVFLSVCSGESGPPLWKFCVWLACREASSQVITFWPVFQEAVFNKGTGKVVLKTFSLYKKLLTLFRAGHDQGEAQRVHRTQGVAGGRLPQAGWRVVSGKQRPGLRLEVGWVQAGHSVTWGFALPGGHRVPPDIAG